ncbi:hypothetical protein FKM82_006314, partial [Ascaphus truei]
MNNQQRPEDQALVDEVPINKEKNADHIQDDSSTQQMQCLASSMSQSESRSDCSNHKRPILESHDPKPLEEDGLGNACLSKRIKLEIMEPSKEGEDDVGSNISCTQECTHIEIQDVAKNDFVHSKEHLDICSSPNLELNQEELRNHLETTQVQGTTFAEEIVTDFAVENGSDVNCQIAEDPLSSKSATEIYNVSTSISADLNSNAGQLNDQATLPDKVNVSECLTEVLPPYETENDLHQDDSHTLPVSSVTPERNLEDHPRKTEVHETINSNVDKPETSKGLKPISKTILSITARRKCDRVAHERSFLFRRKHGFGQAKKRLHLMSTSKKVKGEDRIVQIKHNIQAHRQTSRVQSAAAAAAPLETESINEVEVTADQDSVSAFSTSPFKVEHIQNVSDRKVLRTCAYCGHVFQNRKGLETHVKRKHTKEMQFYCQPCGYSCVTRGDFEKHCQSNRHQTGEINLECHLCTVVAPDELIFQTHMSAEHNMCFHCVSCKLYFRVKEDIEHHEKTEHHLCAQEQKSSTLSKYKLALQNAVADGCPLKKGNIRVANDIEITLENDLMTINENQGNKTFHFDIGKPQFQCKKCFYKTRSSTVLTRHIKLRHAHDYHFLCKACNIYSMCKEGMEKHIKRSKHIENAKKNNIGLLFEECIEKVWFDGIADPTTSVKAMHESEAFTVPQCSHKETLPSTEESLRSSEASNEINPVLANAPKRGRPKGNISRTCTYCGLLASSVTNLTVHIKRKHSHQYSYLCKVCNYYTVTKGDMERHCTTKKHKSRVEEEKNGQHKVDIVVSSKGTFENTGRKKKNIVSLDNEHFIVVTNAKALGDSNMAQAEKAQYRDDITTVQVDNTNISQQRVIESDITIREDIPRPKSSIETTNTKCTLCNFLPHSVSSLEMHVKRKHTKEFEYCCMACDYYAVTRREMRRHATTEKHQIKRQSYQLCSPPVADDKVNNIQNLSVDFSKNKLQEKPEECVAVCKQNPKPNTEATMGDLQDNAAVDTSTTVSTSDIVDATKEISICRENNININGKVQPTTLNNGGVVKNGKEFNGTSRQVQHLDNTVSPSIETNEYQNVQGQNLDIKEKDIELLEKNNSEPEHTDIAVVTENEQIGISTIVVSFQQECSVEKASIELICPKSAEGIANDSTVEILFEGHHGTEAYPVDNIWGIDVSASDDAEYRKAMESCKNFPIGTPFDSSIVKLRKCQEIELTDRSDGQVTSAIKDGDSVTKKCDLHPAKRRKSEGSSKGETSRIRCDDCGFLADGLSGLNVHIAMKHPTKEKHFHCLLCGKSFFTESNLHQHLASAGHLRNEEASFEELPEGGATFKCVKCTEPFDSEQGLFLHIKEQHEELLREVNKYIVEDTEQINREREDNKGSVCKYCGKICKSSNSMAFLAHIRTHT